MKPGMVARLKPAGKGRAASGRRAPSGLREDIKRFTRERMITAALDSFASHGFRATTIERIVELAGTTAPTFYRHFSSKRDLLVPLQEHLDAEVTKVFLELNKVESIDFVSIRAWLDKFVNMWMRTHNLCIAYWEASEIDRELAANAAPHALYTASKAEECLAKFNDTDRESVRLRLALLIPLLDRATKVISCTEGEDLRENLFDEFTHIIVLFLRNPGSTV